MGCNCNSMPQPIQDNQYKEAPQQAPYLVSQSINIEEIKQSLSEYHKVLIDSVLYLDPAIGYGYRPDLVHIDPSGTIASWKEIVYTQLPDQLRDLKILIENHIERYIKK